MNEICHCGQPLHYSDKSIEIEVKKLVEKLGRYIEVCCRDDNVTYKVDRHYIALHGLKGKELNKLGFEVINE